jgi:hypothetical protein
MLARLYHPALRLPLVLALALVRGETVYLHRQ